MEAKSSYLNFSFENK